MRAERLAESVAHVLTEALGPVAVRLTEVEADRNRHEALLVDLASANAALRERLAVLETRPPVPGPPGPPGRDGQDGVAGKDGTPGLQYCGVYVDGRSYARGDVVTWAGSAWHCHAADTTLKPGEGCQAWQLVVKRGRDGRDLRP